MKIDNKTIYYQALDLWGENLELLKAIEELSELTKEICKYMLKPREWPSDDLVEEIADVEIMIEQLKIIFNCEYAVSLEKKVKLERLEMMIKNDLLNLNKDEKDKNDQM